MRGNVYIVYQKCITCASASLGVLGGFLELYDLSVDDVEEATLFLFCEL